MNRMKACVWAWSTLGLCVGPVFAAEVSLVPISSSGPSTIMGNEIILDGGGQRVFLEIRIAGWDPDLDGSPMLSGWQTRVDSSGYSSGLKGMIAPAVVPCTTHTQCTTAFGTGARCDDPPFAGVRCTAGFVHVGRSNYVLGGGFSSVDLSTLDYGYLGATSTAVADPGTVQYAGTLVLDVPVGALGTFTIALIPDPETLLLDETGFPISSVTLVAGKITVTCETNADCNDDNACTNDTCLPNGTCSNQNNYNPATHCCNPNTGELTVINDNNVCTTDVCQPDGSVTHNPAPGPCNDGIFCNGSDTCVGTTCTPSGIDPCPGPNGDDDCSESCNEAADNCTANDPNGTACDDGVFCNGTETCTAGNCTNSSGNPCPGPDGDADCAESCDEAAGDCLGSDPAGSPCDLDGLFCTDDACDGGGDCAPGGDPCPGPDGDGDCSESCNEAAGDCTADDPNGSACDDGDPCTGTGRPGIDPDTCDGSGACSGEVDPECNDQCTFAVPATEGVTTGANNNQSPIDDVEASCQPDSNNDVWFTYTASCDGAVFVSTTGSVFAPSNDPVLSIYDACPDVGGMEIACDDDSGVGLQAALTFAAASGTSYWIRVAGFEDNTGDIVLNILPFDECLIDGVCYAAGELNPANGCEACIPVIDSREWTPLPEGAACGDSAESECDNPDACDGAGVCESNYKPEGTACGDPTDTECDNPDTCSTSGTCLPNYEPEGLPCGSDFDDQCDNPDTCTGGGDCAVNFEPNGTPCDDGDVCTGGDACDDGTCVGTAIPQTPLVVSSGCRHLAVTPVPTSSPAPVALRVTSPHWPCLNKYINASGRLVASPVSRLPNDWGTIVVQDPDVVPESTYRVVQECGSFVSPAGSATTSLWADTVGIFTGSTWPPPDGRVDLQDVNAQLQVFSRVSTAPPVVRVDLWPCLPDGRVDLMDVVRTLMAFGGIGYVEATDCPLPCP